MEPKIGSKTPQRSQRSAKILKKQEKRHVENDAEIVMAPKRGSGARHSDFSEFFDHRGRRRRGRGEAKATPRCWLDTRLCDLRRSSHPGGVRRIFDRQKVCQKTTIWGLQVDKMHFNGFWVVRSAGRAGSARGFGVCRSLEKYPARLLPRKRGRRIYVACATTGRARLYAHI